MKKSLRILAACAAAGLILAGGTVCFAAASTAEENTPETEASGAPAVYFTSDIPACLLGIASPLCMYGTIPIAASFRKQGMREDWLAAVRLVPRLCHGHVVCLRNACRLAVSAYDAGSTESHTGKIVNLSRLKTRASKAALSG